MAEQQATAPPEMRAVVDFLRGSKAGLKNRVGVIAGKRADYFKAKGAIKALLSPAYAKLGTVPKVSDEQEAKQLLTTLIPYAFYLRAERGGPSGPKSSSPKMLQIIPQQGAPVEPDHFFVWFYEGSQVTTYLGGALMVGVILAGVMFPLWPQVMRIGVWYLSMAVLGLVGLFFALAIVRLIFYIITIIVASPGIWIFPKLFADVGFVESFIPVWEWDIPKKKRTKKERAEAKAARRAAKAEKAAAASGAATPASVSGTSTPAGVNGTSSGFVSAGTQSPAQRSARIEEVADEDD
jgi:translocation protein SEC62